MDILTHKDVKTASLKLNDWYPQYLKIHKKKVKEATMYNYVSYYKWYIEPYPIGKMSLCKIKRSQLVAHFQYLADEENLAEGTLKALAGMLHGAFKCLVADNVLSINPASNIMESVSAREKEEKEALTHEQMQLLIDFLKQSKKWIIYLPYIAALGKLGCRYGEVDALTWEDIDFDNREIHIYKTLHYRKRVNERHNFFITTPKTKNSNRVLPMDDDLEIAFKMQKAYQEAIGIPSSVFTDGYSNFVFTTKKGKPFTHEGFVAILDRIRKHANEWEMERAKEENREAVVLPKLLPHLFRFTFVTNARGKMNDTQIVALMGHANERTLPVYTDYSRQDLDDMRENVSQLLKIF